MLEWQLELHALTYIGVEAHASCSFSIIVFGHWSGSSSFSSALLRHRFFKCSPLFCIAMQSFDKGEAFEWQKH